MTATENLISTILAKTDGDKDMALRLLAATVIYLSSRTSKGYVRLSWPDGAKAGEVRKDGPAL